jgi:hypothetical protein
MHRSSLFSRATLAVGALLAATVLVVVVGGVFGRDVAPSPAPSIPPSSAPSVEPGATPSPQPTVKPTDGASDGPFKVALDNLTEHDVSVVVNDETGTLAGVTTGQPGDGMSVRWFDVKVENLDAGTIRVTWVGLPRDEEVRLLISGEGGAYRLRFVQAAPPANSDAVGYDRILVLRFHAAVDAEDVEVTFRDESQSAG